jgi:hypothetical protein
VVPAGGGCCVVVDGRSAARPAESEGGKGALTRRAPVFGLGTEAPGAAVKEVPFGGKRRHLAGEFCDFLSDSCVLRGLADGGECRLGFIITITVIIHYQFTTIIIIIIIITISYILSICYIIITIIII